MKFKFGLIIILWLKRGSDSDLILLSLIFGVVNLGLYFLFCRVVKEVRVVILKVIEIVLRKGRVIEKIVIWF